MSRPAGSAGLCEPGTNDEPGGERRVHRDQAAAPEMAGGTALGFPALFAFLAIFWLMVAKPW